VHFIHKDKENVTAPTRDSEYDRSE